MKADVSPPEMMGSVMRRKKQNSIASGGLFHDQPTSPLQQTERENFSSGVKTLVESENGLTIRQPTSLRKSSIVIRKQLSLDLHSHGLINDLSQRRTSEIKLSEINEEYIETTHYAKKSWDPTVFTPYTAQRDSIRRFSSPDEMSENKTKLNNIRIACKRDYVIAFILFCIMTAICGTMIGWKTHVEEDVLFGHVGLACRTPCFGDIKSRDFFNGRGHSFSRNDVLKIGAYIDPLTIDEDIEVELNDMTNTFLDVDLVSTDGTIKRSFQLGPAGSTRMFFSEFIQVDSTFKSPQDSHVLNVKSSNSENGIHLSFTLYGEDLSPLANHRVMISALILFVVYVLIATEVLHRTLVAIFGSLFSLFLYYLMNKGRTEELGEIMLHMEWSTLALIFGLMIIVGELSQTGIFEWSAVRLLLLSKGSCNRLMVLLCCLTATSSAFLDNVTTMLLIAPVTIDICTMLCIDPRPYLIGEVILSNIGGTATLIGDPPNIIIGSDIEEVGFVDFIINIAPCIVIFCIPISLAIVSKVFAGNSDAKQPLELDRTRLTSLYPIYDEPRLLIAGIVASFVIMTFFFHPIHHKDSAWISLLGAFLTITFTHPHDVQTSLRNHVEWDTLLFFAGLFVLVAVVDAMGLLTFIGEVLVGIIESEPEEYQQVSAISLIIWVSAITSGFLDNIPFTTTMIPVIKILAEELPNTLHIKTLAWSLSFGACLGGNMTLLGASANIVTAGIASSKGYQISHYNFFVPGSLISLVTIAISHLYMLIVFTMA